MNETQLNETKKIAGKHIQLLLSAGVTCLYGMPDCPEKEELRDAIFVISETLGVTEHINRAIDRIGVA